MTGTVDSFNEAQRSISHGIQYYGVLRDALYTCYSQHTKLVAELASLRERGGRLFVIGVGGGAANAAHAVCDFRKLCGIETYAPTDGIAELTARTNDDGWQTVFAEWLRGSRLGPADAVLFFSVGGGHARVSVCISEAVVLAREVGARILGVVGRSDGAVARLGDVVVVIARENVPEHLLTPVTETVQVAVLHALVSDPRLQVGKTKW